MLQSPLSQATTLVALGVTGWALTAGKWPERVAGATVALDWIGGLVLQDPRPHHHVQTAFVVLDLLQAGMFIWLVLASRRIWVLWGAAIALLSVLTHLTVLLDTGFGQWSYLTALYVWAAALVVAMAGGMAFEAARPTPPPFMGRRGRIDVT